MAGYHEGYLKKAGELNPSAKARYFQVWVDPPVFSYYKNAGGQHIKTVRLAGPNDEVVNDPDNSTAFSINTKDRNWNFFAENEAERKVWFDIFNRACSVANASCGRENEVRPQVPGSSVILRIKVPKTIETEGLVYYHCTVEAEFSPQNVQRSGRVLRFSQLNDLDQKVRAHYQANFPDLVEKLPPFPPQRMRFFTDHTNLNFIEERKNLLDAYFDALVQIENMSTNPEIWKYMGLSSFRRSTVLVTNADTRIGHAILTSLTSSSSSAPYLVHATVANIRASSYMFMEMRDKIELIEIGEVSQRSQLSLNQIFSHVDTVILAPDENDTVEMGLAYMMAVLTNRRNVNSVILISATGAGTFSTVFGRQCHILEEQIRHVTRNWTIVRLNMLMDTFLPPILANLKSPCADPTQRVVSSILDPDALLSPIAAADVGVFVRAVIENSQAHSKMTYQLTGAEATTMREVCETLGKLTHEAYAYRRTPAEEFTRIALADKMVPRWKIIGDLEVLQSINSGASLQSAVARDFGRFAQQEQVSIASYLRSMSHSIPRSISNALPLFVVFDASTTEAMSVIRSVLSSGNWRVRAVVRSSDPIDEEVDLDSRYDRNMRIHRRNVVDLLSWKQVEVVDLAELDVSARLDAVMTPNAENKSTASTGATTIATAENGVFDFSISRSTQAVSAAKDSLLYGVLTKAFLGCSVLFFSLGASALIPPPSNLMESIAGFSQSNSSSRSVPVSLSGEDMHQTPKQAADRDREDAERELQNRAHQFKLRAQSRCAKQHKFLERLVRLVVRAAKDRNVGHVICTVPLDVSSNRENSSPSSEKAGETVPRMNSSGSDGKEDEDVRRRGGSATKSSHSPHGPGGIMSAIDPPRLGGEAKREPMQAIGRFAVDLFANAGLKLTVLAIPILFQSLLNLIPENKRGTRDEVSLTLPVSIDAKIPSCDENDIGKVVMLLLDVLSEWNNRTLHLISEVHSLRSYFLTLTEVRRQPVECDFLPLNDWCGETGGRPRSSQDLFQVLEMLAVCTDDGTLFANALRTLYRTVGSMPLSKWRSYLRTTNRQDILFQEVLQEEDNKKILNGGKAQHPKMQLYQILEPLGLGAAGCTVVKVQKRATGGIFALKILDKKILHYRKLWEMECALLKQICHANLVELDDYFEDNLNFYMVMHFCAGGDLFDQLESCPSAFTEPVSARVIVQCLKAVQHCHSKGIVHRDLKPANIVITEKIDSLHPIENINIKIIDFGVAMQFDLGTEDVKALMTGTKHYMAPEILTSGVKPTAALMASDLWSTGVILFVLLTYSLPFFGSDEQINAAIRKGRFVFPEDNPQRPGKPVRRLSPSVKDLITRLLDKDWRRRLTCEQAFEHPWIQYHMANDKARSLNSTATPVSPSTDKKPNVTTN